MPCHALLPSSLLPGLSHSDGALSLHSLDTVLSSSDLPRPALWTLPLGSQVETDASGEFQATVPPSTPHVSSSPWFCTPPALLAPRPLVLCVPISPSARGPAAPPPPHQGPCLVENVLEGVGRAAPSLHTSL